MSLFQVCQEGIVLSKQMEYMHSTAVPPPEVTIGYKKVKLGYVLFCYALVIKNTSLLVDDLTIEWLDQYGSSLKERSGTSITVLSDGRGRLGINHKPQMTSDGGVYTCNVSLSSENMFTTLEQPVTNVMHTVIVTSKYVNLFVCVHVRMCMCLCVYVHVCISACTLMYHYSMYMCTAKKGIYGTELLHFHRRSKRSGRPAIAGPIFLLKLGHTYYLCCGMPRPLSRPFAGPSLFVLLRP